MRESRLASGEISYVHEGQVKVVARYDVYANPDPAKRKQTPYLLDVQNDYIDALTTRVVVPLQREAAFGPRARNLNPASWSWPRAWCSIRGVGRGPAERAEEAGGDIGRVEHTGSGSPRHPVRDLLIRPRRQ